jgi:hypothetical protein
MGRELTAPAALQDPAVLAHRAKAVLPAQRVLLLIRETLQVVTPATADSTAAAVQAASRSVTVVVAAD